MYFVVVEWRGKNNFLRPEQECVVAKAAAGAAAAYFFDMSAKGHRAQPRGDCTTQLTKPFGLQSLLYYKAMLHKIYVSKHSITFCWERFAHYKYHIEVLLYVCYNYYD